MDLRVIKTKRSIKQAFLQLRSTTPLESIRIADICKIATINKTTFYKHYRDVFKLSTELENESVERVLKSFPAKSTIFDDPMFFLTELPKALNANRDTLYPLFHDNFDKLFILLERHLKKQYGFENRKDSDEIFLTFVIGGTLHTLRSLKFERNCDDLILAESMSKILKKVNELRSQES